MFYFCRQYGLWGTYSTVSLYQKQKQPSIICKWIDMAMPQSVFIYKNRLWDWFVTEATVADPCLIQTLGKLYVGPINQKSFNMPFNYSNQSVEKDWKRFGITLNYSRWAHGRCPRRDSALVPLSLILRRLDDTFPILYFCSDKNLVKQALEPHFPDL